MASTGVAGLMLTPAPTPRAWMALTASAASSTASAWKVMQEAPAWTKASA